MAELTDKGLAARRAYQRALYAKRKREGTLPPDRYDRKSRKEYNQDYYRRHKAKILEKQVDRWNEKGEKNAKKAIQVDGE